MRYPCCCLCLLLSISSLQAQDANYWASGYGPGGFFSPGAVIANNRDSGVLFYNPALLALTHKRAVSISGTIYQHETIKVKNGIGRDKDLRSRLFTSIPQMLSGSVELGKRKPVHVSYALIHQAVMNYNVSQRQDTRFNVLRDDYSPGMEYFIGQYSLQNQSRETSALISSGFRLNEKWAVGLTTEAHTRSQHYNESLIARALISTSQDTLFPPVAANEALYQVSYTSVGLRFRAGLSYEAGRHHLGLVLSTPLIHLHGNGTLFSDNALINIKDDLLGDFNVLASTRQTKLKSKWKAPLSIALGYALDIPKGQIYIAGEYFTRIKEYNIITPRDEYFIRPDTGINNQLTATLLKLRESRKAVCNIAVGVSYELRERINGYFAFRTDFNYAEQKNVDGFSPNTAVWDNFHCQIGANIRRSKYNLRLGLLLGYGATDQYKQPFNFDNPSENNFLQGEPGLTKATHLKAGLMVAFVHNL